VKTDENGAKQIKLIRFFISHLSSLLRHAPHALVPSETLPAALTLFARIKSLVQPCRPCHSLHQQLASSSRHELSTHVSPLLDALVHSLLTSTLLQPASRLLFIQQLCQPSHIRGAAQSPAHQLDAAVEAEAEADAVACDDAAGRLALAQSALNHVGTHTEDVQQAFVSCLPHLFDLLQSAAPHCLLLSSAGTKSERISSGLDTAEPPQEEEADLLFRCSVMMGALLSVVSGKLRSEALRTIVSQVLSVLIAFPSTVMSIDFLVSVWLRGSHAHVHLHFS